MKKTAIASIAFWVVFVGSFGLYRYWPTIDTVWVIVGRVLILALAVFTLIKAFRDHKTGEFSYQGLPRWLLSWLIDDEERKSDSRR